MGEVYAEHYMRHSKHCFAYPYPNTMPDSPSPYFSYLLRLWLAGDNDQPEWRLALIDPQTDQAVGFASLETLIEFLRERMEEGSPPHLITPSPMIDRH